jgi:hypothetical protein
VLGDRRKYGAAAETMRLSSVVSHPSLSVREFLVRLMGGASAASEEAKPMSQGVNPE